MANRRKFQRPLGDRRYKKLFVLAVEGTKTEPQYFALFNSQTSVIHVNCLKSSKKCSPHQILKRMKDHLKQEALKPSDEAWIVTDKDSWTDQQLTLLHAWAQQRENYGFALSNPKFEYWLLLHFEEGADIPTPEACTERLKRHLPDYDKGIDSRKFNQQRISEAIARAKKRDNPPCLDWPRKSGGTTVYKLVEKVLGVASQS